MRMLKLSYRGDIVWVNPRYIVLVRPSGSSGSAVVVDAPDGEVNRGGEYYAPNIAPEQLVARIEDATRGKVVVEGIADVRVIGRVEVER